MPNTKPHPSSSSPGERWGFRAFALGFGLLALTGCGTDDDTPKIERPEGDAQVYRDVGWTTETDPLTGLEYRCLTITRGFGGSVAGGLGIQCFEADAPENVESPS